MVALVVAVLVVAVLVGAGPRRRRPRRRRPRRRPGPLSIRLSVPYFLDPTSRRQRTISVLKSLLRERFFPQERSGPLR